jgi:WD40 repeat protein
VSKWHLPQGPGSPEDPTGGELAFSLAGHDGEVRGVDWSPDGKRFASISVDGTVGVWGAAPIPDLVQNGVQIVADQHF